MSFDLERAKKEGCIYVTPEGEFQALILSDSLKGIWPLAVVARFEDDDSIFRLPRNGVHSSRIYLKNKPQKLEVRIWKDKVDGSYRATISDEMIPEDSFFTAKWAKEKAHVKTIEVEI